MSVKKIFEPRDYGPALEATQEAVQWLKNHDRRFGAYLNALGEKGVHIVTVNDYLAKRDSIEMGQIYNFLGLSSGYINKGWEKR